jgi:PAS domain S-box-containing protein
MGNYPDMIRNPARLAVLRHLSVADGPSDSQSVFDRLTRLAAHSLSVPMAMIVLVEEECARIKSGVGLPESPEFSCEVPLSDAICPQVVVSGKPLIIEDTRKQPAYKDLKTVKMLNIVAYAGVPLTISGGHAIGSFCISDTHPRTWTDEEITILEDIAALAADEFELRSELTVRAQAELLLQSMLNSMQDTIIFAKDRNSKFLVVNMAHAKLMGAKTPDDVVGKDDFAFFPKDLAEKYSTDEQELFESGQAIIDIEERTIDANGMHRIILTSKFPLKDNHGNTIGLVGSGRDITVLKRIEQKLADERNLLRALIDTAPDYIFVKDREGRFILSNIAHAAAAGLEPGDLIGKVARGNFPEELAQRFHEDDEHVIQTGKSLINQERLTVDLEGNPKWVLTNKVPLRDDDGNVIGLIGVSRDITEQMNIRQSLEGYTAELARSNEELQQFAYVASHDLQEPLRMVASYLQLLEMRYRDQLDQDAKEFIDYAVDGATRMKSLINALLSYSRVETRGKPFVQVDCESVLERALFNLQTLIQEAHAVIMHDPLPTVMADDEQLVQVFQNLIGNAIKFRDSRVPEVRIGAVQRETDWLFCVRDNGIGIEADYLQRVFVIFQRLHTRQEYEGTGIGLAICQKIIKRHHGSIWVESTPDEGSTFYFTLPIEE